MELRFDLYPEEHGWTRVRITLGDARWEDHASHIKDCVYPLAVAGLQLAEHLPVAEVVFYLEPAGGVLTCDGDGDIIDLRITEYGDVDSREIHHRGMLALQGFVPRRAVIRAIWTGLRRLEAAERAAGLRGFPTKEVAALGVHARLGR